MAISGYSPDSMGAVMGGVPATKPGIGGYGVTPRPGLGQPAPGGPGGFTSTPQAAAPAARQPNVTLSPAVLRAQARKRQGINVKQQKAQQGVTGLAPSGMF